MTPHLVDWSDLAGYVERLGEKAEFVIGRHFHRATDLAGVEVQRAVVANLGRASGGRRHQFNRTGKLGQAVSAGVQGRGHGLGRQVQIGAPISYATPVEFGSNYGAAVPPRARLALWARRKLSLSERDSQVWAFHMQERVRREGIKPHPFMHPALDQAMDGIDRIYSNEHSLAVAKLATL